MLEHLSQSSIKDFFLCPEKFRRYHLDGDIFPAGLAARIGTGLHKGAEVNHRAKLMTGEDEPLDVVQDAARDGYVEALQQGVFFAPDEVSSAQSQIEKGIDTVTDLAKTYHEDLAPDIHPVFVEEPVTIQTPDLPLPIRGVIDVYTQDKWLLDMKTSSKRWSQSRADTDIQPTIYRELIKEKTGAEPVCQSFAVFVKTKTPQLQHVVTRRTNEDFARLVTRIQLILRMISAGIFPPAPPDSWICSPRWCGYYWTCPYMAHPVTIGG